MPETYRVERNGEWRVGSTKRTITYLDSSTCTARVEVTVQHWLTAKGPVNVPSEPVLLVAEWNGDYPRDALLKAERFVQRLVDAMDDVEDPGRCRTSTLARGGVW